MTSKDFVEQLQSDFLEIYSLLRRHKTNAKYANEFRGTGESLIRTGVPHPTAEKTHTLTKDDFRTRQLLKILSIDYSKQLDWMCAPIFREMIVFYDKDKSILSILNICLSCDRIEDGTGKDIKADTKCFDSLREYFKQMGHDIEED